MVDREPHPSRNVFFGTTMVTENNKNGKNEVLERSKKYERNYEVSKKEINKYNKEKGDITKKKFENHMLKEVEDKIKNGVGKVDEEMLSETSSLDGEISLNRSSQDSTRLSSIYEGKDFRVHPLKEGIVKKYKCKREVEKQCASLDLKKKMDELRKVKAFFEKDRKKYLCHNKEREEIKNQEDMKLLEQIANEKNVSLDSILPFKDKIIQKYMEVKRIERAEKLEQINNEINIISKLMREEMNVPKESKWEESLRKSTTKKSMVGSKERELGKGFKQSTLKEMDWGKDYRGQSENKEENLKKIRAENMFRREGEEEVEGIKKMSGIRSTMMEGVGNEIGPILEFASEADGDFEKRSSLGDGIETRNETDWNLVPDEKAREPVKETRRGREVEEIDVQVSQ